MSRVFVVEGWFGSLEWLEAVCADEATARELAERLNAARLSERTPPDARGVAKFGYDEWPLLGRTGE